MPGIKCGDMGPKLGYASKDNGWLTFEHVKIPRDNLLQRFIKLDDDGSVSFGGDPRAIYTTMIKTRLTLTAACRIIMMAGLTIGLRYSAVRR
jgi:acyl-CoA oxidase